MAVEHDAFTEPALQRLPQAVAQRLNAAHRPEIRSHRTGRPKSDRQKSALGSGAPARFVAGAVDDWLKLEASPDIQRADAFRRVELVTGDRQHIDAELAHIGRDFSDRLRSV